MPELPQLFARTFHMPFMLIKGVPELCASWDCILQNMQRDKDDQMNSGDFIRIDYVGKIKESGEIFDITKEDAAKQEGIYNPQFKYGPVPVIIDANFVLPGLNEVLKEMKVGDKVLYGQYSGEEVKVEGVEYKICEMTSVRAIIK